MTPEQREDEIQQAFEKHISQEARHRSSESRDSVHIHVNVKPDNEKLNNWYIKTSNKQKIELNLTKDPPKKAVSKIVRAPGSSPIEILRFVYSKKTFERVFVQIVLDMRDEHAEALLQGRMRQAQWIHIRGILILLTTTIAHAVASCGKTVAKIWKLTP